MRGRGRRGSRFQFSIRMLLLLMAMMAGLTWLFLNTPRLLVRAGVAAFCPAQDRTVFGTNSCAACHGEVSRSVVVTFPSPDDALGLPDRFDFAFDQDSLAGKMPFPVPTFEPSAVDAADMQQR